MDQLLIQNKIGELKKSKKLNKYSRKIIKYKFMSVENYEDLKPKSYTILTKSTLVITKINGKIETKQKLDKGDVVISGVKGEKYGLQLDKFLNTYELGDATNKKVERTGFQIPSNLKNKKNVVEIVPSWGGTMKMNKGDYILLENDASGFYGVEKNAFQKTYRKV